MKEIQINYELIPGLINSDSTAFDSLCSMTGI